MSDDKVIILGPGEGERVDGLVYKATARDGFGHFSFIEETLQPRAPGPPLHIHDSHDEAFYVVRGDLTMRAGEQTVLVKAGGFVFVPSGIVHGFANRSTSELMFVFMHAPGGFEQLFREMVALPRKDGRFDREAGFALAAKYDDQIVGPPLGA